MKKNSFFAEFFFVEVIEAVKCVFVGNLLKRDACMHEAVNLTQPKWQVKLAIFSYICYLCVDFVFYWLVWSFCLPFRFQCHSFIISDQNDWLLHLHLLPLLTPIWPDINFSFIFVPLGPRLWHPLGTTIIMYAADFEIHLPTSKSNKRNKMKFNTGLSTQE